MFNSVIFTDYSSFDKIMKILDKTRLPLYKKYQNYLPFKLDDKNKIFNIKNIKGMFTCLEKNNKNLLYIDIYYETNILNEIIYSHNRIRINNVDIINKIKIITKPVIINNITFNMILPNFAAIQIKIIEYVNNYTNNIQKYQIDIDEIISIIETPIEEIKHDIKLYFEPYLELQNEAKNINKLILISLVNIKLLQIYDTSINLFEKLSSDFLDKKQQITNHIEEFTNICKNIEMITYDSIQKIIQNEYTLSPVFNSLIYNISSIIIDIPNITITYFDDRQPYKIFMLDPNIIEQIKLLMIDEYTIQNIDI